MIKYEKILSSVLYCTVLYCSIDVLGCDCCKKLCVKSGEEGVPEEKGKWLEKDPNTGEERALHKIGGTWTFLGDNPALNRKELWSDALKTAKLNDDEAVPVVFNACNKKKTYWETEMPNKKIASGNVFAFRKDSTFKNVWEYLKANTTIDLIDLSCEGGNEKIIYEGSQEEVGNMKIVEVFTAFKNAKDPFLERIVCLSFSYNPVGE